jgi:predicted CopG family antitoxin
MPTTTVTLNAKAYNLLKSLKTEGSSFSDVILEYTRPPARTGGEILKRLEEIEGKRIVDDELMRPVREGRGRSKKHVSSWASV